MKRFDPLAFVAKHGVVLASGKGKVPNVAEALVGEPIRGSWWGHARGHDIFAALNAIADSADVLCFKLVGGKVTFVHRRVWPALVRLEKAIGTDRLAAIHQEHTERGAHRNTTTPFPKWAPADVVRAAEKLSEDEAREMLGEGVVPKRP